jgi:hypothetical protein
MNAIRGKVAGHPMKLARLFSSLLMVIVSCTGCWPVHIVSSPGASGFVIDRQTRAAIPGAQVAVSRSWQREWPNYGVPRLDEALAATRPPLVFTDADGHFSIPPEKEWMKDFPPPETSAHGTLVVRREGYKPVLLPLEADSIQDVGIILLTPLAARP